MIENVDHIDELIVSVLSGNAGVRECAALKDWINASDDHRRHFVQMSDAWFAAGTAKHLDKTDVAAGFARFTGMLQPVKQRYIHRPESKRVIKLRIPHIAAMLIAVFALGAFSYRYFDKPQAEAASYCENIVPLGSKSQIVLTDGTKVWLNAGSRLRYATSYAVSDRHVQLEGEAYFEVVPNKILPFEVKTSKMNVKAIGTTFNVKAYPNDTIIETILVEGKVEVSRIEGNVVDGTTISLNPKQRLTLVKRTGKILFEAKPKTGEIVETYKEQIVAKQAQDSVAVDDEPNIRKIVANNDYMVTTTWKDKRWRIDSEELRSLATKLERRYNIHISFADNDLQYYCFNGTLEDEPIEAVLKVMAQTAPVKFELNGSDVVLMRNEKFREQHKGLYKK